MKNRKVKFILVHNNKVKQRKKITFRDIAEYLGMLAKKEMVLYEFHFKDFDIEQPLPSIYVMDVKKLKTIFNNIHTVIVKTESLTYSLNKLWNAWKQEDKEVNLWGNFYRSEDLLSITKVDE